MITHTFLTQPIEQLRPRATNTPKGIRLYDPAKVRLFKQAVASEAMFTYRGKPLTGPLRVKVTFYRTNQKGQSKIELKRREQGMSLPVVKPDLDNYVKSFLDALHGIYWPDDASICEIIASKKYSSSPRIEIEVSAID